MGLGSLFRRGPFGRGSAERAERALAKNQFADAALIYRKLAESGDSAAQVRLAQLYERGQGVVQSFVDAVRLYRAAAEQGSVVAQARLGEIYLTGLDAPATASASAIERLKSGDAQGSVLNRLFPQGMAVNKDLEEAVKWNTSAAELGDAGAQARLGYQYASGLGVERDLAAAERWYLASAQGDHVGGQLGLGMLYAGVYGEYARGRKGDRVARQGQCSG